ncbi:hypothetical protein [Escherichia phage EC6]|uniref:Uncharacterized protein n=1 Tax=Escherichia phage EC6 TaxID=1229757 RepID=K4I0M7_9CAUD|nr:hypothetical protein ACQ30_gp011 [Escherichia phage EC6]AFU62342.1 hypothetical protein [Escherichia phage EC6]
MDFFIHTYTDIVGVYRQFAQFDWRIDVGLKKCYTAFYIPEMFD